PLAGSAGSLVGAPAGGSGRGLRKDSAVLNAVRLSRHQRDEARMGGADRRGVHRRGRPFLPRVRGVPGGRRRKGNRVCTEKTGNRGEEYGGVFQVPLRRGRSEGRGTSEYGVRRWRPCLQG